MIPTLLYLHLILLSQGRKKILIHIYFPSIFNVFVSSFPISSQYGQNQKDHHIPVLSQKVQHPCDNKNTQILWG